MTVVVALTRHSLLCVCQERGNARTERTSSRQEVCSRWRGKRRNVRRCGGVKGETAEGKVTQLETEKGSLVEENGE